MSPFLRCRIQNPTPKIKQRVHARACFDTGAQISTIPRSLLNKVRNWQNTKGPRDVTFIAANGTPMGVGEFAKFKLVIEASEYTLTLGPVLITDDDGIDGLTILIGTPDLKRNRINVDIVTDEIVFPDNTRLHFESSVPHTKTGRMAVVKKVVKPEAIQRSARESAKATNPREKDQGSDSLVDSRAPVSYAAAVKSDPQPNVDRSQLDECDEYRGRMKNQAEKLKTYTRDQVNRQPDLLLSDLNLTKELITTRWECRRVFSDTISRATNRCAAKVTSEESEWSIHGQFGGLISNHFLRTGGRAVMRLTNQNWSDEIKQRVGQTTKSFYLAQFGGLTSTISDKTSRKVQRLKNQNNSGKVTMFNKQGFETKEPRVTKPMRTIDDTRNTVLNSLRKLKLASSTVRFVRSKSKLSLQGVDRKAMGLVNQNFRNLWIWECGAKPSQTSVPKVPRKRMLTELSSFHKTTEKRPNVQFRGVRTTKLNEPVRKTKVQRPKNQNELMDQELGVKRRNHPQALQLQDSIQFGGLISKLPSQNVGRKAMGLKNQHNRMNEELYERRSKLNRLHFSRTSKSPTRTAGRNELKVSKRFRKETKSFPIVHSVSLITAKLSSTNRGTKVMELANQHKAETRKEKSSRLKNLRSKIAERSQPTLPQTANNQLERLDLGTQNRAVGCQTKSPRKGLNKRPGLCLTMCKLRPLSGPLLPDRPPGGQHVPASSQIRKAAQSGPTYCCTSRTPLMIQNLDPIPTSRNLTSNRPRNPISNRSKKRAHRIRQKMI